VSQEDGSGGAAAAAAAAMGSPATDNGDGCMLTSPDAAGLTAGASVAGFVAVVASGAVTAAAGVAAEAGAAAAGGGVVAVIAAVAAAGVPPAALCGTGLDLAARVPGADAAEGEPADADDASTLPAGAAPLAPGDDDVVPLWVAVAACVGLERSLDLEAVAGAWMGWLG
jgi:hypothetical protein